MMTRGREFCVNSGRAGESRLHPGVVIVVLDWVLVAAQRVRLSNACYFGEKKNGMKNHEPFSKGCCFRHRSGLNAYRNVPSV